MKSWFLILTLFATAVLFSEVSSASGQALASADIALDHILLEVNHSSNDFVQLTQSDLDKVKHANDSTLKSVYFNARFFIMSFASTHMELSNGQKIQLIYFFQGIKDYAPGNQNPNMAQNFCRYSTDHENSNTSVYGSYELNAAWANEGEDFDHAVDAAFAIYAGAEVVSEIATEGVISTAANMIKDNLHEQACEFMKDHVPTQAGDATEMVCRHATQGVHILEGIAQSLIYKYILGQYTAAFSGMAHEIQDAARLNIHNGTIALQRCVMAGYGSEGNVSIVRVEPSIPNRHDSP